MNTQQTGLASTPVEEVDALHDQATRIIEKIRHNYRTFGERWTMDDEPMIRLRCAIATAIDNAVRAERDRWEAVANYEELARCPKAIRFMIAGVVDQCGKGQWFNVTHRLHEVQSEVATRLQRAVNGDPAHMSPNRIGGWGFRDDRGPAAKPALAGPESTQNQHKK